jgi:hypothetical protein
MHGISWLAEQVLDFQEGLRPFELVTHSVEPMKLLRHVKHSAFPLPIFS